MNGSTSRWLAWTGPLFVTGFAVIIIGLEQSTPGETASVQKIQAYYGSHQGRTTAAALMAPAGALLLIMFASYVRSLVRERNDNAGVGPTVFVAGAVLWAAGIAIGSSVDLSLVGSAHHHLDASAQTLNQFSNTDWIPFIAGIAVTLVGAGMTVLRTRIVPVWLGWVALVFGIASVAGPAGFVGFFVAPLWILVVGIMLGVRKEPPVTTV
jgi:hypothetical protein